MTMHMNDVSIGIGTVTLPTGQTFRALALRQTDGRIMVKSLEAQSWMLLHPQATFTPDADARRKDGTQTAAVEGYGSQL